MTAQSPPWAPGAAPRRSLRVGSIDSLTVGSYKPGMHKLVALFLIAIGWSHARATDRTCTQIHAGLSAIDPCEVVRDEPGVLSVVREPAVSETGGWLASDIGVPDMVAMLERARAAYAPTGLNRPLVMVLSMSDMQVGVYSRTAAKSPCVFELGALIPERDRGHLEQIVHGQVFQCALGDWLGLTREVHAAVLESTHAWWVRGLELASTDRLLPRADYELRQIARSTYDARNAPPGQSDWKKTFAFFRWLVANPGVTNDPALPERAFFEIARRLLAAGPDAGAQWRAFAESPNVIGLLSGFGEAVYRRRIFEAGGQPIATTGLETVQMTLAGPKNWAEFVSNGTTKLIRLELAPAQRVRLAVKPQSRGVGNASITPIGLGIASAKVEPPHEFVFESPCQGPSHVDLLVTAITPEQRSIILSFDATTEPLVAQCGGEDPGDFDQCLVGNWKLEPITFIDFWSQLSVFDPAWARPETRFGVRSIDGALTLAVTPGRTMTWKFQSLTQVVDVFTSTSAPPSQTTLTLDGAVSYRASTRNDATGRMTELLIVPDRRSGEVVATARARVGATEIPVPLGGLPAFAPSAPTVRMQAHCEGNGLAFIYDTPLSGNSRDARVFYRFARVP